MEPARFLLIDDDSQARVRVCAELRRAFPGCRLETIGDGAGLARALDGGPFDLAITESRLAWTDGLSAARTLRARWPDLPVVMLTASGSEAVAAGALKAGFDDYVLKTAQGPDDLEAAVRCALEKSGARARRRQADEALRASEEQYRRLFEGHPHPMWIYDRETLRFLAVNDAAVRHYGYSRDEFLAMTVRDIRPEEDVRAFLESLARAQPWMAHGRPWRHRKKDGTIIQAEITSQDSDYAGRPARLVLAHDVTERVQAQERLAHQARVLASLNDAVIATDDTLRITSWNPAAEAMYGYKERDVLGKPVRDVIRSEYTLDQTNEAFRVLAETGRCKTEVVHHRSDGRPLSVEGTIIAVREQGRIAGYVAVNRDITERKRAETALQERARQQALVAELGQQALHVRDLDSFLQQTTSLVAQALDVECSEVLEFLPSAKTLVLRAGVGWKPGLVGRATKAADEGTQGGYTLSVEGPVVVEDLPAETRFTAPAPLLDHGIVSGMSVTIRGQRYPFGVLGAHTSRKRIFSTHDAHFLEAVANILATAILRRDDEDVRTGLLHGMMSTRDEERRRIARELHDGIGQSLTSLLVGLRALQQVGSIKKMKAACDGLRRILAQTLEDLGLMARGLHPAVLDDLGLVPALQRVAEDHARMQGIRVMVEAEGLGSGRLPPAVEHALYRIAQEALANAARHASAKSVRIRVTRAAEVVELTVQDDGMGFDATAVLRGSAASRRLGLLGMRERAGQLGGSVAVDVVPGQGTQVFARLPVPSPGPLALP